MKLGDIVFEENDFDRSIGKIERYIEELKDHCVFFDVDGTLCDYRFGEKKEEIEGWFSDKIYVQSDLYACREEEWTKECLKRDTYEGVRPLTVMMAVVKQLGVDNCFVLTVSYSSVETEHKKRFVSENYGIPAEHIFSVGRPEDKVSFLLQFKEVYNKKVALVDDTLAILDKAYYSGVDNVFHSSSFCL